MGIFNSHTGANNNRVSSGPGRPGNDLEFEMDLENLEMTWILKKNVENLEFCESGFHILKFQNIK